jgi:hypothetical protein
MSAGRALDQLCTDFFSFCGVNYGGPNIVGARRGIATQDVSIRTISTVELPHRVTMKAKNLTRREAARLSANHPEFQKYR